eukprot:1561752-Ditylum_brightwellii.AAC.1
MIELDKEVYVNGGEVKDVLDQEGFANHFKEMDFEGCYGVCPFCSGGISSILPPKKTEREESREASVAVV